ncbi:MAG: FUSC family protein [Janthinobacterium lividum]
MLAPVFPWLGLLIAAPGTSFIGMVISTNMATLAGLNNVYASDFAFSLNAALALITGIALTTVIMSVIRARTTEGIADFLRARGRQPELAPPHDLRDQLLTTVAGTVSDHRDSMLLALAGIRVVLFRDHAPAALM